MNLSRLAEPFPVNKIHWRVGAMTKDKSKGIALAYLDARDVMKRLDDVCGVNWQCRYPFPGCCEIGLYLPTCTNGAEAPHDQKIEMFWLWRANGAGETNVEGEKGQYSDAFKRAAVMWGIGRYLYSLPNEWVQLDQYKRIITPPELPHWATPEGYREIMKARGEQ